MSSFSMSAPEQANNVGSVQTKPTPVLTAEGNERGLRSTQYECKAGTNRAVCFQFVNEGRSERVPAQRLKKGTKERRSVRRLEADKHNRPTI